MYKKGWGRIGNYISQGVNSVSAPFHPFGGAVDIIVVEQQDGSLKSSPWYVRFGKFQGVLKAKEKVVKINVNGAEADFHMYLDHKGEAYFLRELHGEEGDPVICPSSSGEETDEQYRNRRPVKFKSCNCDASLSNSVTQIDVNDGKVVTRTNSGRSRILGLVFGRKSMKNDSGREEEDGPDVVRRDSLERAEFAANLLEVKWSTNLASNRGRKDNASRFSTPNIQGGEADKDLPVNDGQGEMCSSLQNNVTNSLDDSVFREKNGFHDSGIINSNFSFQKLGSSDKDLGVELSCLNTKHIVETLALGESGLQENYDLNSRTLREIDELGIASANPDENAKCFIPETISPDPESAELDSFLCQMPDGEQVLKEYTNLPGQGVSEDETGENRVEAFVYCETSETSGVGLHNAGVNLEKALYVSCRGCAEVCVQAATLHQAAELISEVTSVHETSLLVAKEPLDAHEILADGNCGNFSNEAKIIDSKGSSSNSIANSLVSETYAQVVTVAPINVLVKEVEPCSICTVSGLNNSAYEAQKEENCGDEDKISNLQHSSESIGNSQEFRSNNVSTGAITSSSPSEGSEGEQLLFGDLDDFNHGEVKFMESISSDHVEKGNSPSGTSEGNKAVIESVDLNFESSSSSDMFAQENILNDVEDVIPKSRMASNCIKIPRSNEVTGEDVKRMAESLPNMRFHGDDLVVDDLHHSLGYSLDSNSESSKWTLRGGSSSCIKPDTDEDIASHTQSTAEDAQILEELKHVPANPAVGNLSSNRSWRAWPFSFKRSKNLQTTQPAQNSSRTSGAENSLESSIGMDGEKDVLKTKMKMKKVREVTPTPEQLASLNLKQGKNIVTFTFSTAMLGPQQVDARIYLWKWDARIVISDVDGTITKSDVLGQFMPFVGVDWSQTGVAHLFSAIKENGYQLLFLSARAISQAYHTRQFLFNLKQDGKGLPDGPVVISPDGLFPSLFREVIRRAPHEFKIGCLEDIRVLFPSDCNPFYAGFGNRDTDEISYLKVGVPRGKIFIINPKGEVVVNRRVDSKSYTSLHVLVHDMFPPMTSEQFELEKSREGSLSFKMVIMEGHFCRVVTDTYEEDFNSWNYWKLPPPAIDI